MPEFDWLGSLLGGAAGYAGSRGGEPTTTTNNVPPEFAGLAAGVGQRGLELLNQPYTPYEGNRVSNLTPYHFAGFDMAADRALNPNGLPQQADAALGGILSGAQAPQAVNPYMGATSSSGSNPWEGRTTSVGSNPYAGANPFLEQNIQNTLGDMTRSYNQNVAPTMAANAFQSGSFGNAGQQEMENSSRDMLQRNLGRVSGDLRMQDYGMQQGLAEADINRRMNAQQTDLARSAGIAEGGLNRSLQGQLADLSRNAGLFESGADRALRGFDNAQGRVLQGIGMSPTINAMGYDGANRLMGIGDRIQGHGQDVLNSAYGDFTDARDWATRNFNTARSPFGGVNPGFTSSEQAPGTNPIAGLLGGAAFGNRLFTDWNTPPPPSRG